VPIPSFQPYAARGAELGKALEDRTDARGHGLIGVKAHFAILLTPDKAHRQSSAQLPSCGLIADPPIEPGAQDMQLRLTHGALEPQHQAVVEESGVVYSIGIADQGVGHPTEIEQSVPIGIVGREAGDFEPQHDARMA